jgi:dTDP-4-dehydrorhamnose reductase
MVDLARPPVETVGFCNASTRPLPDSIARAIDLDDERAVAALFACERPDVIINCAGVCLDCSATASAAASP